MNSCRQGVGLLSDGEFAERVAQGDPLVQAIYDYKARTGQWPQQLTAEVLTGAKEPEYRWSYQWRDAATPPELIIYPMMHCFAKYRFPDDTATPVLIENKWTVAGESFGSITVKSTAHPSEQISN